MTHASRQFLAEAVLKTRHWKYSTAMAELTETFEKVLEFEVSKACRSAREENAALRDSVRDLVQEGLKHEPFRIVRAA